MIGKLTFPSLFFLALIANGCTVSETQPVSDTAAATCEITDWHVNNLSEKFANLLAAQNAPTKDKKRIMDFNAQDRAKVLVHPFQQWSKAGKFYDASWVAYDYLPEHYFEVLPLYYQDFPQAMTIVGWDVLIADDCEVTAQQVINLNPKNDEPKFLRFAAHWNANRNFVVESVKVLPVSDVENLSHIRK